MCLLPETLPRYALISGALGWFSGLAGIKRILGGRATLNKLTKNLPKEATSFVGRERELADISALLRRTQLLTLTGSGGCGKSRLALRVAADLENEYGDGVWLVELAPLADPGLVARSLAAVFGLMEEPGRQIEQTLTQYLKGRRLLLLMDTCEHLLTACSRLAHLIQHECPTVAILATSRAPMGIAGELSFRVPSLSFPEPGVKHSLESLLKYESIRLFTERASRAHPGFQLTNDNSSTLASICRHLDGIPLAIELAAARVRTMEAEEVNQLLDDRLRLQSEGAATALLRHQTLRSLIDWSYDLLTPLEKSLLCRVSVFVGGWTLEAAEQVCSSEGIDEFEVLDLLTSLVDNSLVAVEERRGKSRYNMLDTVRQYATERLFEAGVIGPWRRRHLAYFVALGEEAEPSLRSSEQQLWLDRLESEHDNVRSAIRYALDEPGEADSGLALAGAIWRFWSDRGYFGEGRKWLELLLAKGPASKSSASRARALNGAGTLAWSQGEFAAAWELLKESLALYRELKDQSGAARALGNLALVAIAQGENSSARQMQEESLTIRRELGDSWGTALALNNLGLLVGTVFGDCRAALTLFEESVAIYRALGYRTGTAMSLGNLGFIACELGDFATARTFHEESLTISSEVGDKQGIAEGLQQMGRVYAAESDFERVVRILGCSERLREEIGAPMQGYGIGHYDRTVAAAREAFGDDAKFDEAWRKARALTMEQAVEYALGQAKAAPNATQ